MEMQVEKLKYELEWERDRAKVARETVSRQTLLVAKYDWLREQELMLMTADGVKYLKGEDLDAYVEEKLTPQSIDLTEAALKDMTERFSKALQQGMGTNKIMWAHQVDIDMFAYDTQGRNIYGGNTREKG